MKTRRLNVIAVIVLYLGFYSVAAKSLNGLRGQAFTVVGSPGERLRQTRSVRLSIANMRVTSVVRSRFARVTTVSEMENTHDEAKELTFSVRLPEAAFITEFTMRVEGITFVGKVKEKELAEKEYKIAKHKGHSAGLVTANVRETQTFSVAANVPAHSSVSFSLVYQELLKRKLGKYNHEIFINPGQIVDEFVVNVYITERTGITMLSPVHPKSGKSAKGKVQKGYEGSGEVLIDTKVRRSKYQAKVSFKPNGVQQRRLLMLPEDDRKLSVTYDVTREVLGGDIQTRDGYFVHYFAPDNLPILPKKIVFVIDRSGSMSGRKIDQTKTAFESVLNEMSDADEFNIVTFASDVTVWKETNMVGVTNDNVAEAITYVKSIRARGGTDLNGGLLNAAKLLKNVRLDDRISSAIIVLTDGAPTSGVTNEEEIRLNIKRAIEGRFSLFCLGFGNNLNHDFLKRLGSENDGITRKIYEDSDADLQLEGFFQEVATPLLLNVKMLYSGANVVDISKAKCEKYFEGSEIIVVGAMNDSDEPLKSRITGMSLEGEIVYDIVSKEIDDSFRHWYDDVGEFDDFIERIWAYFTIKELLEDKVLAESKAEIKEIIDRVTSLALKYSFVTPVTSMVVVLPEDEITTTPPTSSTIHPPIPPCFMRDAVVPDYLIGPPIWCPYIFDGKEAAEQRPQPRYSQYYRQAQSSGSVRALSPRRPAAAPGPQYTSGGFAYSRFHMLDYSFDPYPTMPAIERADACSGVLSTTTGRITSPPLSQFSKTVYCIWDVKLPSGFWIDLYVEKLNTTRNVVRITSDGNTVLEHQGGMTAAKYISIEHSQMQITLTVFPTDTHRPDIVISYKQFDPRETSPYAPTSQSTSATNCGNGISSRDGLSGFITSPNYPSAYPSNANCLWTFVNEDVGVFDLQLRIIDKDIETNENKECVYDKLTIEDGDQTLNLCGFGSEASVVSNAETVTVSFSSDEKLESAGFKAAYEFTAKLPSN